MFDVLSAKLAKTKNQMIRRSLLFLQIKVRSSIQITEITTYISIIAGHHVAVREFIARTVTLLVRIGIIQFAGAFIWWKERS